ncbi:MAG: hypothetical protein AAGB00_07655 [Planctomycetota bacterium]
MGGGAENLTLANRAAIANALIDAGVDDRAEPSLGVLGRNIEAYNVLQSVRYAMFLRHSLGTSASGWVAEIEPAIAGHPDAPLFRALAARPGADARALAPYLRRYRMKAPNYYSTRSLLLNLPRSTKLGDMTVQEAKLVADGVRRASEIMFIRQVAWAESATALQLSNWMASASRNAPIRFATYIRYDWERAKPNMDQWLRQYGENPVVMRAAAERYLKEGDRERAEELFEAYLAAAPELEVFRQLARIQYARAPEDERWLATLARVMDTADYGLSHASAAANIGATLMWRGDFSRAEEWTERAAASGAAWGMQLHVECLTALGKYDDAEQITAEISHRYRSDSWYDWCAENGRGRLADAWDLKQARLRQSYPAGSRKHEFAEFLHLLVTGEPQRARLLLEERLAKRFSSFDAMWLASLCDEQGLTEQRDATLKKLAEYDPGEEPKPGFSRLAPVMQNFLASGKLDEAILTAALEGIERPEAWKSAFRYFVGVSHMTRGRRDKAIGAWRHAAAFSLSSWERVLAWRRLRDAGVEPATLEGRYFEYALRPAE